MPFSSSGLGSAEEGGEPPSLLLSDCLCAHTAPSSLRLCSRLRFLPRQLQRPPHHSYQPPPVLARVLGPGRRLGCSKQIASSVRLQPSPRHDLHLAMVPLNPRRDLAVSPRHGRSTWADMLNA